MEGILELPWSDSQKICVDYWQLHVNYSYKNIRLVKYEVRYLWEKEGIKNSLKIF